jgi:hypothetical protein
VPASGAVPTVRLLVDAQLRWKKTWGLLTDPQRPVFVNWRKQSGGDKFDPATVTFTDDGSVTVDATTLPGSVLVYPKATDPNNLPVPGPKVAPNEPLRGRRLAGQPPGAFSWDRLSLRKQEVRPPAGGSAAAERQPIVQSLAEGTAERPGEAARPLAATYRSASDSAITHIAVDPVAQGCLINADGTPPVGYDPDRMLSFWTAVLAAVRRCADPGVAASPDREDSPTIVLTSADLQDLRADALAVNLIPLLAGVLLYAWMVVRGVANAPTRRTMK